MKHWYIALVIALSTSWSTPWASAADELPEGIIALEPYPAPELALEDLDGEGFDLDEARGQWVFVHFWASWCGPCRREMPAVERMVGRIDQDDWEVVLINTAESEDTVWEFLSATAPGLESLLDRDGLATEDWEPRGLPATYLVDPQGRVRYQALGGREWDQPAYLGFLERLASESQPAS